MILVTGGAGFIGSNLHAALYGRGAEAVVVDHLGVDGKWRNLQKHPPSLVVAPEHLPAFLASAPPLDAIVHLGAISETTASDGDSVWHTNVTLSQELWRWCAEHDVRFIYASSASTYGTGAAGFDDAFDLEHLRRLRPLNLYGWSKHAFDLWVAGQCAAGRKRPPQWVGLKFFNVYGPNEYHKGAMISVVKVKHDEIAAGRPATLFRSDQPQIPDGAQARDFIWIDDVIAALMFLLDRPGVSGLFNLGTGTARTYADLASAVFAARGETPNIEFIPMPTRLHGQYQSFTEARIDRLRAAGFETPFTSLEQGIAAYVSEFLTQADPYR
ncbi:ADP-glyceromanno-heptose 6-epimerase [Acidiphilium acidophilum]|jgi:ADP-glyceromanno-heptose 6-epimerase precursor (EC 5.1.3.20)|uniref:ADP-L-glycero-D-manno-heptose-6-epimerase n=1 Tax=Acidiphilium acidophilum TaxID=76588 RepID=A0AAW9DP97_ACIAO|nr:ADP-glyceromanno-heptose 6-epimerase [Acidiphilium acidophilum]MDX5930853.1 ADP-glyceromanno-heptose 6-epimerase [Acidiphilium acidophilum]